MTPKIPATFVMRIQMIMLISVVLKTIWSLFVVARKEVTASRPPNLCLGAYQFSVVDFVVNIRISSLAFWIRAIEQFLMQRRESNENDANTNGNNTANSKRASARLRSSKQKPSDRKMPTKGKSRRIIFKQKSVNKAKDSFATITTADCIFYKGQYYQVGDIIFVIDEDDGLKYYAQCRSFIVDNFCEKSAVLTWLLPRRILSPIEKFDPELFYLGPNEEFPRKMEYLNFVSHAPSNYFALAKDPCSVSTHSIPIWILVNS